MADPQSFPTGTVTFLFTDIEGGTQLLQRLGGYYADVLAQHRQILRSIFETHSGHEVDTQGDAFFIAFERAGDAVAAAVEAQHVLAAHAWPEGAAVRVRMGLHTGEPARTETGYVGIDVHRGARLMAAAHGGQVLLSQTTRDLVEDELPHGVHVFDWGRHCLRDIARPLHIFELIIAGLPTHFPPLRTLNSDPAGKPEAIAASVAQQGKFRVLVIEDDASIGRLIVSNLARANLECRLATDGIEGVAEFKLFNPNLILSDIMMPGIDGRSLCSVIRDISTVPIILITAADSSEAELAAFKAGADDYIAKPFDPKLLAARVVAHLRRVHQYDARVAQLPDPVHSDPMHSDAIHAQGHAEHQPAEHQPADPVPPPGWITCKTCHYLGPVACFKKESSSGERLLLCPHCRESQHLLFAIS